MHMSIRIRTRVHIRIRIGTRSGRNVACSVKGRRRREKGEERGRGGEEGCRGGTDGKGDDDDAVYCYFPEC